jgi:hypothetical protein
LQDKILQEEKIGMVPERSVALSQAEVSKERPGVRFEIHYSF